MKKYIVKERFRDADEYIAKGGEAQIYEPGTDVSKFDKKRLENLVNLGYVEAQGEDDEPKKDTKK